MINESCYWKDDLLNYAKHLLTRTNAKIWDGRSYAKVEKEIMIGFYIIRKLSEASRLSSDIPKKMIPVLAFPVSRTIHRFNVMRFYERCDFTKRTKMTLQLSFVTNQIIHSYVFDLSRTRNGKLDGIFFASDWKRKQQIFWLSVYQISKIFKLIGNDYPDTMRAKLNEDKSDFDIVSWKHKADCKNS